MEQQVVVTKTAEARYNQLATDRDHFIARGDKCAKLTIPTLFKRDVTSAANMTIKDPEQSFGARGVNTLASKMILSLFPINTPFFKLNMDLIQTEDIDQKLYQEVQKGLGVLERQTIRDIENSGDVTVVFEALKHLIVVGNVLCYVGEKGTRIYDLNKYVVVRDPQGEWIEIVIKEEVSPAALKDDLVEKLKGRGTIAAGDSIEKTVAMFTHIKRVGGTVEWHQEIGGIVVDGSESSVPEEGNPWLPLRFLRVDGENYGRSYVEMFLGDINSLEVLTKAVNEGSAAAAKVIFLVRANGTTNPKVIAQAPNLSVRTGDADDVSVLKLDKAADLAVAKDMIATIERRLAASFMITTDVVRDAERVTAEEIRIVAQELDGALGGIYSLLSKEFQLPYVRRRLHLLRKKKKLKKLPENVSPAIVTGFSALGRGHDGDKLMRFLEKCERAAAVAQALGGKINLDELITRFAIADGISTEGLLIPLEEQQLAQASEVQNQVGMTAVEKLGPEMIRQAGPAIQQMIKEGSTDGVQTGNPQG